MAKATSTGLLSRIRGRGKVKAVDVLPVITDVVPEADLPVGETDGFSLLYRAINHADYLGLNGRFRNAALKGMQRLAESDPERMRAIIGAAGCHGDVPLKRAIMELSAVGQAR